MSDEVLEIEESNEDTDDIDQAGPIIWTYYKIDGYQSRRGGSKNVTCLFCDNNFTGCSTTRAFAHILGRAVLGQKRANVAKCVPIRKIDDDRQALFKAAQKVLENAVEAKEREMSISKAKQSVISFLDLTSPAKRTATGDVKVVDSKQLDSTIANFFYENALSFNVADTPSLAAVVEECIEFGRQHPGRKYKAPHRRKIGGQLPDSAYDEPIMVYIYCNKKAVMAAARDDELKMWDNE